MVITMQSKRYAPELVVARYVRRSPVSEEYFFCEVGEDRRYDLRQGRVVGDELTPAIRAAADAQRQQAFGYVSWPMTMEAATNDCAPPAGNPCYPAASAA